MKVIAFAPHPDDEVIGPGGSLLLHARAGDEVHVVHVIAREPDVDDGTSDYAGEARAAASVLGATQCTMLNLVSRNGGFTREDMVAILTIVRAESPDVVYLPHVEEIDTEHQAVHELVTEALWMSTTELVPAAGPPAPHAASLVLGYEVWTPLRRADYVQDITSVLEDKVAAMRCYPSQMRLQAWDQAIRGLAGYRGCMTMSFGQAEVFAIVKMRTSMDILRRGLSSGNQEVAGAR